MGREGKEEGEREETKGNVEEREREKGEERERRNCE